MSYQIKSTPFFQRIVSTSKRNGQLQKLREEYDRMRDFNDNTIELKMRQVRLKRLFKEIEDIRTNPVVPARRRRIEQDKSKTEEQIRMETFIKARELGKEYSKLNALMVDRCTPRIEGGANVSQSDRLINQTRARCEKAINYGNQKSRSNMQRIAQMPKRNTMKRDLKQSPSMLEVDKMEKLRQRLNYGNSRSSINMSKFLPRSRRYTSGHTLDSRQSGLRISEFRHRMRRHENRNFDRIRAARNAESLQTLDHLNNRRIKLFESLDNLVGENSRMHARELWRKLAFHVRHNLDTLIRRVETDYSQTDDSEYHLRSISNGTDLPGNDITSNDNLGYSDDTDEQEEPDEVFVSMETLSTHDDDCGVPYGNFGNQYMSNNSACGRTTPKIVRFRPSVIIAGPTTTNQNINPEVFERAAEEKAYNGEKPTGSRGVLIQQYVQMYEPNARTVPGNEGFANGFAKLRSVFEH